MVMPTRFTKCGVFITPSDPRSDWKYATWISLASLVFNVIKSLSLHGNCDLFRNMLHLAIKRAGRPLVAAASQRRCVNMAAVATASQDKREGDISDSFASLAGVKDEPLPDQFRQLKMSLVEGREEKIKASWHRLLQRLEIENDVIAELGSKVIPEVRFDNLEDDLSRKRDAIKKRGAAVIRGVVPEDEARQYKFDLEEYIRKNPQTKGEFSNHTTND